MENRKLKVVVCGTTFGQFYCEALLRLKEQFEFVGILAKGSERSRKCAEKYNVKLYGSVEELNETIDIACVVVRAAVMGGSGSNIANKLLNKGIHVIQEQPVHYKEIETCVKVAKKNNVKYFVADLYKNLSSVKAFIKASKIILEKTKPIYIDAGVASQVSFPLIEILAETLNSIKPFQIKNVDRESGPFHILTATIRDVPIIFQVHNEVNPHEPDNYMHYLHRITIGTNSGRICLEDIQGPVRWHNKMHFPLDADLGSCFSGEWPEALKILCSLDLGNFKQNTLGEVFKTEWVEAIANDLFFVKEMLSEEPGKLNMYYARLISNARIWHEFTEHLGFPKLIAPEESVNIDIVGIKATINNKSLNNEEEDNG